ncbi:MAG TPA: 2Fe-2S iron-sulfur cluster-binding protein [Acidimicrobiales bacterium]|nr:2Fe-2S iron-sulfur cluster-binding protein [Acidimicrobiales bacterium]
MSEPKVEGGNGHPTVKFTFEGQAVKALRGQTVAGALVAHGLWNLGNSRSRRQPRGAFCAAGWCSSCLVSIDGQYGRLACTTVAGEDMAVHKQVEDPGFEPVAVVPTEDIPIEVDVAIVGSGIAALAAAADLAVAGAHVAIFEELPQLGGDELCSSEPLGLGGDDTVGEAMSRLLSRIDDLGVRTYSSSQVLGKLGEDPLVALVGGVYAEVTAQCYVWAEPARAMPLLFEGWTRPGVVSGGALRRLLTKEDVAAGGRLLVIGWTDEALWTAREWVNRGGGEAVILPAGHAAESNPMSQRWLKWQEGRDLLKGLPQSVSKVASSRLRLEPSLKIVAAAGEDRVRMARLLDTDSHKKVQLECEAIAVCHRSVAAVEPFELMGCVLRHSPALGGWVPTCGDDLQTSRTGIFAAGASAGVASADCYLLTGKIAAAGALRLLESSLRTVPQPSRAYLPGLWEKLGEVSPPTQIAARRSQDVVPDTPASGPIADGQLQDWTVVCRCEDITIADINDALKSGARSADDVKRLTRCGMGPCQWRNCRELVAEIMSSHLGVGEASLPRPRVRFPLRPVGLGVLMSPHSAGRATRSVLSEIDEHA